MTEPTKVELTGYSKEFPDLRFLLGYFHEDMFDGFDWQGRKPTYKEIIRHYKTTANADRVQRALSQLKEFLALSRTWDDDKIDDILGDDFGNCLFAPAYGMTYREFLEGILEILEEPMEKTRSQFIPKFIG